MRLERIITLLPLCLTACLPFSNSEGDAQAEANNIGPCIEALESIAGDFDGDGTSDQATLYHIPEQTIPLLSANYLSSYVMKVAGVDMSTPEPVISALDTFAELLADFSELMD